MVSVKGLSQVSTCTCEPPMLNFEGVPLTEGRSLPRNLQAPRKGPEPSCLGWK